MKTNDYPRPCPKCGELIYQHYTEALSRRSKERICEFCGMREALEDAGFKDIDKMIEEYKGFKGRIDYRARLRELGFDIGDYVYVKDIKADCNTDGRYIFYKDVPLWLTIARTLEDYEIFMYHAVEDGFYTIVCIDNLGDLFHYGKWGDKIQAIAWLESPHPLY